jgi:hypothetical protein
MSNIILPKTVDKNPKKQVFASEKNRLQGSVAKFIPVSIFCLYIYFCALFILNYF